MSSSPSMLQWIAAIILLAVFAWVLLALLWDVLPTPWVQADKPHKQVLGIALLIVVGLLNYSLAKPVLVWVWMGLRHILGMDLEGI